MVLRGTVFCKSCGLDMADAPMVFRGEQWCSDDCRKKLTGEDKSPYFIYPKKD